MNKEEYIKKMLEENIETATKTIEELYIEVEELRLLPNDCEGIIIDGEECENKDFKIDAMTSHLHVIGYMESLRSLSKNILELNDLSQEDFEEYLKEQEEIHEQNKKEMDRVRNLLDI